MLRRLLLVSLLLAPLCISLAQSVEFGVTNPATRWRLGLRFQEMPSGAGESALLLAAGSGGDITLGLSYQEAGSLATVGNLVLTLDAGAATNGSFLAAFSARGVLGPLALRARASVSDGLEPVLTLERGGLPRLARLGSGPPVWGLELGGAYRVSRALIIDASPALFMRGGQLGVRFAAELELVRALGSDDISLLLHAFAPPGFTSGAAAFGVGYSLNRPRAASWVASGWLGWDGVTIAPGVRLSGAERLADGNLDLTLSAEPYRLDDWPYRLDLSYRQRIAPGELHLGLEGGMVPATGWQLALRAAYSLPLTP